MAAPCLTAPTLVPAGDSSPSTEPQLDVKRATVSELLQMLEIGLHGS